MKDEEFFDLYQFDGVNEDILPTYNNIFRIFATELLYRYMFGETYPNFYIDFKEEEPLQIIYDIYSKEKHPKEVEKFNKVYDILKNKKFTEDIPIMVIDDYKRFFFNLKSLYYMDMMIHNKKHVYSQGNKAEFFNYIWFKATPYDFAHPERFLARQAHMLNDDTFDVYNNWTPMGNLPFLNNIELKIKNQLTEEYNENIKEMKFSLQENMFDEEDQDIISYYCELPVIRYGIYEENGKKICSIGSIQNVDRGDTRILKTVNRKKYQVNKGISEEDQEKVEPKNLISLAIFINLLNEKGIYDIEVPSIYLLDYDFHIKRGEELNTMLNKWNQYSKTKKEFSNLYAFNKRVLDNTYHKEDLISEIKSERLIYTVNRLLKHYPNGNVLSYPYDVDSCMHITIPKINSREEINGESFKEIYDTVHEHKDNVIKFESKKIGR